VARAVFYCNARGWGVLLLLLHFILLFLSLIFRGCKEGVIFKIVVLRMEKKSFFKKKKRAKKKAYASRNAGSIEANQSWKV